jgi:hypothetical protein
MSNYDEQMRLWHEGKITARPIRIDSIHDKDMQILQLIRERDEAREELEIWKSVFPDIAPRSVVPQTETMLRDAEARGYQRGVREAAEAAWRAWTASNDVGETGGKMHGAILALLEKPTS